MNTPDQPITTTIDDVEYVCHVQAAIPSYQSLIKLTGVLSPSAFALLSGAVQGFASEDGGELTVAGLGNMDFVTGLMMLFRDLTPETATVLMQEGFRGIATPAMRTRGVDLANEDELNSHFRGRLIHMHKVFAWSLGCNYKDFLAVARQVNLQTLTSLAGKMKLNKPSEPDTPDLQPSTSPTATPSSSDSSASAIQ